MPECILVYATAPSEAEADAIARTVVSERLAACANISPGMRSVYRWHGVLETAHETILILKTRASLFAPLEARIRTLHSAACPCIVALPLVDGAPDFLRWILSETIDTSHKV